MNNKCASSVPLLFKRFQNINGTHVDYSAQTNVVMCVLMWVTESGNGRNEIYMYVSRGHTDWKRKKENRKRGRKKQREIMWETKHRTRVVEAEYDGQVLMTAAQDEALNTIRKPCNLLSGCLLLVHFLQKVIPNRCRPTIRCNLSCSIKATMSEHTYTFHWSIKGKQFFFKCCLLQHATDMKLEYIMSKIPRAPALQKRGSREGRALTAYAWLRPIKASHGGITNTYKRMCVLCQVVVLYSCLKWYGYNEQKHTLTLAEWWHLAEIHWSIERFVLRRVRGIHSIDPTCCRNIFLLFLSGKSFVQYK